MAWANLFARVCGTARGTGKLLLVYATRKLNRLDPRGVAVEHNDGFVIAVANSKHQRRKRSIDPPPYRRLRVYAFDPSLATQLDTSQINLATLNVRWEPPATQPEQHPDALPGVFGPGPIGEYVEVVDHDPASGCFYAPVDLDDPYLLAQDGLAPAEGTPQFHQQMVYAVAMTTIDQFERALGRQALWAPRETGRARPAFVRRLRIYPHALREANAYYDPEKKALLFGYFPAGDDEVNLPGGMVFTCLSHDVVAHEMTHTLLDGLHPMFNEPGNPDVYAFHEAFADIVALFQHFSMPEVLRHQIARTRGDLTAVSLLGELAHQFGQAIGNARALRSAIGSINEETGEWERAVPSHEDYERYTEPHDRGSVLVAAVFEAFISIYTRRVADLLRIATGGTGILPDGDLHPDLVKRLADEAAKTAGRVLRVCVRALDYCPPVDITFGEYLRAIITADYEVVPDDEHGYRIAFVEAFRARGIYPLNARSLSPESLRWERPELELPNRDELPELGTIWDLDVNRKAAFKQTLENAGTIQAWLRKNPLERDVAEHLGLALHLDAPKTIVREGRSPAVRVHSCRPARRISPSGSQKTDLVIAITQSRYGFFDAEKQAEADATGKHLDDYDFDFFGGCTLMLDLESGEVRYCIAKNILSGSRLRRQREFLSDDGVNALRATYFGARGRNGKHDAIANLHRGM